MQFLEICMKTYALHKQKQFYSHIFELPIAEDSNNKITFQAGVTRLTFEQSEPSQNPFYHFAFNIPENQFREAKRWLAKRVSLIHNENGEDEFDFSNWNAHAVYFFDPAGNIVELIARHDLPNRSNERFGGHSLLSISEIGCVVRDVPAYCATLMKEIDVEIYRNTSYRNFAALGDANGLFIVVSEHRDWYPAGPSAQVFPLKLLLKGARYHSFQLAELPYFFEIKRE